MHDAVMAALPQADALVMAAAVANYTAASVAEQKIAHDADALNVQLVPTPDILADAAAWRRRARDAPASPRRLRGRDRGPARTCAGQARPQRHRRHRRQRRGAAGRRLRSGHQPVTIIDRRRAKKRCRCRRRAPSLGAGGSARALAAAPARPGHAREQSGDLSAHLKYFRELGVDGISRDAAGVSAASTASACGRRAGCRSTGLSHRPRRPCPSHGAPARPRLREIRDEIGDCTRCKLHKGRTNIVFGVGDPHARLMFIGEGPGADEDLKGEPFVGRAGQLLTQIIKAMGFTREQVYIANVVKCRPPENRNPEPDGISTRKLVALTTTKTKKKNWS